MTIKTTPTETRQVRDWQAIRACERARELERDGDYDGARAALSKLWTKIGVRPAVEQLPSDTQAEVLLRVGALSGWLGSTRQIPGAQEFALDLLSESVTLFVSLGMNDQVAEAQTDMALSYWRSGALDEGRVLLAQALAKAERPETKLRILSSSSAVEISSGRYYDALALLNSATVFLPAVADESSHGRYHLQRALAYRNLGGTENVDHALIEYSAASMHYSNAGNVRSLARVQNNIGFILLGLGKTSEALSHLDRAHSLFVSVKDAGRVAQVNETRARVFIAEQRFADAERAVFAAITVLEQGDEHSLLAEALTTQGIAFARSRKNADARNALQRASDVAASAGDSRAAAVAQLTMIEELNNDLPAEELLAAFRTSDELLGERATPAQLEQLRRCSRILLYSSKRLTNHPEEMVGGTLEQELFHFKARLVKRALDQAGGSITGAARQLGLTHQGLRYILDNPLSKTLGFSPPPKRVRRKSLIKDR